MAMESVKMGRIPKKVKEKALRNLHRYHERLAQSEQTSIDVLVDDRVSSGGEPDDSGIDNCSVSSVNRESISSLSSFSPSGASNILGYQSVDSNLDVVVIPAGNCAQLDCRDIHSLVSLSLSACERRERSRFLELFSHAEEPVRVVDLIELTVSSTHVDMNELNENLSALRLPSVFHEPHSLTKTFPDVFRPRERRRSDSPIVVDSSTTTGSAQQTMTVSTYISKVNETSLVDYMFNFEVRYSKKVLQIMKYLAPKLSQPFLIYELDFEVTSFFRYLRWKTLNAYLQHTKRLRVLVERMFGIIGLGVRSHV